MSQDALAPWDSIAEKKTTIGELLDELEATRFACVPEGGWSMAASYMSTR